MSNPWTTAGRERGVRTTTSLLTSLLRRTLKKFIVVSVQNTVSVEACLAHWPKVKMSFWQENYAFIKDVYDTRASKLTELMDKTENAIKEVVADKIYTSEEFKKVKETFAVS